MVLTHYLQDAFLMSAGMVWQTAWSLILGFSISAVLQTTVSSDEMRRALGRDSLRAIVLATAAGAASSSCSYASAAIMRTLFKKGAALGASLAFLFASTNLVLELGLVLLILLGWQFMLAQWIGGLVLVAVMALIVKLTASTGLIEAARRHDDGSGTLERSADLVEGATFWQRLRRPETRIRVAQSFAMEWSMLGKDLAIGFVAGGLVSAFVPDEVWQTLFLRGSSPWIAVPFDALVGPLVAMFTFVCSVGNIPLAAILWAGGASFAGVLSFIYADLIVLPLLDVYRRSFGWRMAAYMFAVLLAAIVVAGILVNAGFVLVGLVPAPDPHVRERITHFAIDHTFWLNLMAAGWALWLFRLARAHPSERACACHRHGGAGAQ